MHCDSFLRLALLAAVLATTLGACASTEKEITTASLDFMVKDRSTKASRDDEIVAMAARGAFEEGMTVDEVRLLLGEPSSVWDDLPEAMQESLGCDMEFTYLLGPESTLVVGFLEGELVSMARRVRGDPEDGGGEFPVEFGPKK